MLAQFSQQTKHENGHRSPSRAEKKPHWPKFFATFRQYSCPCSRSHAALIHPLTSPAPAGRLVIVRRFNGRKKNKKALFRSAEGSCAAERVALTPLLVSFRGIGRLASVRGDICCPANLHSFIDDDAWMGAIQRELSAGVLAPFKNTGISIQASMQNQVERFMKLTLMQLGQIGATLLLALPALYIILSKEYPPQEMNWAFATLGTILGFWLRGKS
jgi:hypothetical protein